MASPAKCPKCKSEAEIGFAWDSGQKVIKCDCGNIARAFDLPFDPQPEFLYKYRPHDRYSESWILNEELFFASPSVFNDPFDSKVMHTFEGTPEQKKKYLSEAIARSQPKIKKRERWKIINRALNGKILEKDYDNHIARIQRLIDEFGIASFSLKPDDLLMFAYYARDHTGYCLRYRRSAENILSLAREIDYVDCYPKFSVFEFDSTRMISYGDKVLFTKSKCWKHEDEWRISVSAPAKRVMKSPHSILEGIILGCNMKPTQRDEIIELNKRRSNPVAIFEARKKKFEFALEIVPIS